MSHSKPEAESKKKESFLRNLGKHYVMCMRTNPMLTKSFTSAFSGALGSFISQMLLQSEKSLLNIQWRPVAAYAGAGFLFIGPSVHFFHTWLDKIIPPGSSNMGLKRLLMDRIFFSPCFLLGYLYSLAILEGLGHEVAVERIKMAYIPALIINYKVWTVLQFLNVKFIPADYRSPFMAFMGLLFTIYIAMKQRS